MVNFIIACSFRFIAYFFFGFALEIFFVAVSKITDGKIAGRDKYLEGKTYLWMIPIYGILLLGVFEPLFHLVHEWPWYCRFLLWAVSFTFFEGLTGWLYDKILGFCPWDYSKDKWKVFERGYTKWSLLPMWGIAGLVIEHYSALMVYLSPHVITFILQTYFS